MIYVLSVTASDIISCGLELILSKAGDISYLGHIGNFVEYGKLPSPHTPDVVIIDIQSVKKPKSIELKVLTDELRDLSSDIGFIAMTDWANKSRFDYCRQLDIRGFCLKTIGELELIEAIRAISIGEANIHSAYAEQIASNQLSDSFNGLLSKRHLEILNLVLQGLTNEEIADRLFISLSTVKSHINVILKKLNARDRAQVISRLTQDMIDDAVNQRSHLG